jgi:SAM-dependent methyltransferase
MNITADVKSYWNRQSCGTDQTSAPKFSREYFDDVERFRYDHEPFIPAFVDFAAWKGKKVLEVGYGAGTDFAQFARAGANLTGIDLTDEAASNVARRLQLEGLTATFNVGNAEALPFDDGQFDLTYSWGVIHHADDTEQCLREIARVTRRGGTVKLMLYNYNSMDAWVCALRYGTLDRRRGLWHNMESVGTKAFTKREVVAMAERCGLVVQSVTFGQQLVRRGARFETIRKIIRSVLPSRWGWYMMIEATKS